MSKQHNPAPLAIAVDLSPNQREHLSLDRSIMVFVPVDVSVVLNQIVLIGGHALEIVGIGSRDYQINGKYRLTARPTRGPKS